MVGHRRRGGCNIEKHETRRSCDQYVRLRVRARVRIRVRVRSCVQWAVTNGPLAMSSWHGRSAKS